MPFDFSTAGRSARERIAVPGVPMESIRRGSHAARNRARVQAIAACAAIAVGAIGAGTGLGAKIYHGVRVWTHGGQASMRMHSFVMVRDPMAADVRAAIAHATFPVVFPVGVPAVNRIVRIASSPAGRPSALVISYNDPAGREGGSFVLVDPAVVDADREAQAASARLPVAAEWRLGSEIVLVGKNGLSPADAARVKAAMIASSPSASLAAVGSTLPTVTVLDPDAAERLALAEQVRPANGRSVLVGSSELRSIARLAERGAPIRDRRTYHANRVPYAGGKLDYQHLTGTISSTVAIAPGGVRAIAAVLRSANRAGGGGCGCNVLFNQPNSGTYWIWTIPASGAADGVQKYAVDATTFAVTPAT
jgi:hypothetical protein